MTRATLPLALVLTALAITPAEARVHRATGSGASLQRMPLPLPMQLPGSATAARTGDWLVGAQPGAPARAIAARHNARALLVPGTFRVARGAARALADDLRRAGLLRYAQPNVKRTRAASFEGQEDKWARVAVIPPAQPVPAPSIAIGVVDDRVDPAVADLAPTTRFANQAPVAGAHGTQVASNAAAPRNGIGVVGIFPSAPIISYGTDFTCGDIANGILAVVNGGAKVVNLSLGGPHCQAEFEATQIAYGRGALIVAAAGNEFEEGNPVEYPSSYPHVLSVAAVDPALASSYFSNQNVAIDLAAPGEAVPVDVPVQFDKDGIVDGVTVADGTSFAAPIVSGSAAFVMASRPNADVGQVADLLRASAVDIGGPGYDPDTGFGLVNVPGALAAPLPRFDPLEPNDDIPSVNGTIFGRPDAPVFGGGKTRTIRATVDATEDPIDVYRVKFPRRAAISVRLTMTGGDSDLYAFDRSARSFSARPADRSERSGTRPESLSLVNSATTARFAYIVVDGPEVRPGARLDSSYALTLRRVKRR